MLSRDFAHDHSPCVLPRRVLLRSRGAELRRRLRAGPAGPAAARCAVVRTGLAGDLWIAASLLAVSLLDSDGRKPRRSSTWARRERRISSEKLGLSQISKRDAEGCIIQAGRHANEP